MAVYDIYGNSVSAGGGTAVVNGTSVSSVNTLSGGNGYEDVWAKISDLTPKWDGAICLHRGWNTAPGNTLQAIWETKKNGMNMVELDIRRTSDNQYVLCHDPTKSGTVDGVETTYTIADETLETLTKLVLGMATWYPNATLPSLESALSFCRRIGMRIDLDMKVTDETAYTDVLSLCMKHGMQDNVMFTCYSMAAAKAVKTAYPKASIRVDIGFLKTDTTLDTYCINNTGNVYFYLSGAMCGKTGGSNVSGNVTYENDIIPLKQRGYKMYVWNVGKDRLADVMQWEPDVIQLVSGHENSNNFVSLITAISEGMFPDVSW